jgi:hypothetical protein
LDDIDAKIASLYWNSSIDSDAPAIRSIYQGIGEAILALTLSATCRINVSKSKLPSDHIGEPFILASAA